MYSVTERVIQFNADRLPEFTSIKYKFMSQNAFRFLRGACHIFYEDLQKANPFPQYPVSWICGDLHLENFGSFKGDNRLVYFDLNDFDEAVLAPATYELARITTSIFTGFQPLGINHSEAKQMSLLFLNTYSSALAAGKPRYIEPRIAKGIVKIFLEKVEERKIKALMKQRTIKTGNTISFLIDKKRMFAIDKELKKELVAFISNQPALLQKENFKVLDAAFRIAGTGSIGVKRYVFLLQSTLNTKKFFLLDMKQAKPSSLHPYITVQQPAWENDAVRVTEVQHRMQNISPALLNTVVFKNEFYVIKEMQPTEDKIDFIAIKKNYKYIARVIQDMALLTASSQLRSSGRQGSAITDEFIAFGKDVHWQHQIIDYASDYSKQVTLDFQNFSKDYSKKLLQ